MKILIGLTVWFLSASMICAQHDPKAENILNAMSKNYEKLKSFKADFSYVLESPQSKVKEEFVGNITVKGEKYFLKLGSQEVINNGATVWTFMKEENEVNISDYTPDDDEITPTKIYSLYKKGFKYILNPEEKVKGIVHDVIDLVPEDKNKPFFKIRLWILKKDRTIASWKIFEKNGNRYLYTVTKFTPNPPSEDKLFSFDKTKYKGVEIVDLR